MRVINISAVLREMLGGAREPVEHIEFIHHSHADVYRVTAAGQRLIAHVDRNGSDYLGRLHRNLSRLATIGDGRVPQIIAWADHREWAVLVCREIPGDELSRGNATPEVIDSLGDLLLRVHSLPVPAGLPLATVLSIDDPHAFEGFAEQFVARISDLPIERGRVRRHLDEMSEYLRRHRDDFQVTPRFIHGDLHRSNIAVSGAKVGLVDWADLVAGDYAFDLATLKFVLDAIAPRRSSEYVRRRARLSRERFKDRSVEVRLRYFLALAGLVRAFHCAGDIVAFRAGRAWRVRACYLHSEAQWTAPLHLEGRDVGGPARRHEDWAVDMHQPIRGLFYLLAPKRVS